MLPILLAIAWLALVALFGVAMVRIGRRSGLRWMILLPVLRLAMLGLLLMLLWRAFGMPAEQVEQDAEAPERPPRLIVIHDRSQSMDFAGAPGKSRAELAAALRERLETLAAQADPPPRMQHLLLGANLVPEADAELLQPRASNLNRGLNEALGRFPADRLLILSDGAATDGFPPSYLQDWLSNRRLEVRAICPVDATAELFDAQLVSLDALPVNPGHAEVVVRSHGRGAAELRLELLVDGAVVAERRLDPGAEVTLSLRLPVDLRQGWHVLEARVSADVEEITMSNNRRLRAFQVLPPNKVLILYGSPRRENLHLVRALRADYAERLVVHAVGNDAVRELKPEDFQLIVLSGVNRDRLPPAFGEALRQGATPMLILPAESLPDYALAALARSPVQRLLGPLDLTAQFGDEGRVVASPTNKQSLFAGLEFAALKVNLVQQVVPVEGAHSILAAQVVQQPFPLVLADDAEHPRLLLLLTDTTWKWAMHPAPEVRYEYRLFWNTLFAWLLGDSGTRHPLLLEVAESEDPAVAALIRVTPRDPRALLELSDVRLEVDGKPRAMRRAGDGFVLELPYPEEIPAAVYVQALASYRQETWQSERRPIVINPQHAELLDAAPQPEVLAALATEGGDGMSWFADAEALLAASVAPIDEALPPPPIRMRDSRAELFLAAILFLLVALEWYLERRLHERRGR